MAGHFLIVEADFYKDIAEAQRKGAIAALEGAGASYTIIAVPGALEIPAAIAFASSGKTAFAGYVALGCVIRGETTHYETVCNESARGIMELAIHQHLAIGNGILTVENSAQAWVRADMTKKDKGGDAARAALVMADMRGNMLAGKGTRA